jgi:hypothetical protein
MATEPNNGPKTEPTTEPQRQSDRGNGKPLDQQSREEPNTERVERDVPDENGEPPSVKRPGGNAEESEPPVENI